MVYRLRFWSITLCSLKGGKVSPQHLQHYATKAGLTKLPTQDISTAITNLRQTYQDLKTLCKQNTTLRQNYLEDLAEAIVLMRSPNLHNPSLKSTRESLTLQQLKSLIQREKTRRIFRKIGLTLRGTSSSGLSRIDIPDPSANGQHLGDPNDPKTWRGPWKSIYSPDGIAQVATQMNVQQYKQAHSTPFGSGLPSKLFGRHGDTLHATSLLQGTLPPDHGTLMPERVHLLSVMSQKHPTIDMPALPIITDEEFIALYKVVPEDTSTSPSGSHIGHYKATLKFPKLVSLHTAMMSIPFQCGVLPDRWKRVTNIMLEKDIGNPRCHRLRIIALFESDFNQAKRLIIGRKLLHHMEDTSLAPTMQFGSMPGKQCPSAVLKKVLAHDTIHISKRTAAFMELDAVGCYDRIVNSHY
jgi:hypothetical protein